MISCLARLFPPTSLETGKEASRQPKLWSRSWQYGRPDPVKHLPSTRIRCTTDSIPSLNGRTRVPLIELRGIPDRWSAFFPAIRDTTCAVALCHVCMLPYVRIPAASASGSCAKRIPFGTGSDFDRLRPIFHPEFLSLCGHLYPIGLHSPPAQQDSTASTLLSEVIEENSTLWFGFIDVSW